MIKYAQTNLQLYNQLIKKDYSNDDLKLIKKAYELSICLFAGKFQKNGKDFICHNVGTASILCNHNMPAEIVAAGLLHNVYGNGNFGLHQKKLKWKRQFILKHLGEKIEKYLYGFYQITYTPKKNWRNNYLANPESVKSLDETEKLVLLILLADIMEHNSYSGFNSFEGSKSVKTTIKFIKENGKSIVMLARLIECHDLADEMDQSFEKITTQKVHPLFQNNLRNNIEVIVPRSYKRKLCVVLHENAFNFFHTFNRKRKKFLKKAKKIENSFFRFN